MLKKLMIRSLVVWLALSGLAVWAETLPNLYSAIVPVTDQSPAALDAASQEALSAVLVKVSGSDDVLRNPDIGAALQQARKQVQQYAYIRNGAPDAPLSVRFEFDGAQVTQLVTDAGASLWTANRPAVLAWAALETADGPQFVNEDSSPAVAAALRAAFEARGVPLQFPLYDIEDTAEISPRDVWNRNSEDLRRASSRYRAQHLVVARITRDEAAGTARGDWRFLSGYDQLDRRSGEVELAVFMRQGANLVADEMAAMYAVASVAGAVDGVRMAVTGVADYADYAGIVSWLENLELIEYANVERVKGDRLELRLGARADIGQLPNLIELNKYLQPTALPEPGFPLSYQWLK